MVAEPFNHALAGDGVILTSAGGLLTGCLHEASIRVSSQSCQYRKLSAVERV